MNKLVSGAAAAALSASVAHAGGIERSTQSVGILFEEGNYAELSYSTFNPNVSGVGVDATPPANTGTNFPSGNMSPSYTTVTLAYKQALSDKLDVALILDQPIGADINYPGGTSYIASGATAEIDAMALTALIRYKLPSNFSVIGGVRALRTDGVADLPYIPFGYTLSTTSETDFGYVVGVAWEKPEIAARVALTYNSSITHKFRASEQIGPIPFPTSTLTTEVPQSVNLEFQTGIAADTLLFGSIRWVDWTAFDISPAIYANPLLGLGALVEYDNDVITYNLGIGRRFSDQWSGALLFGYEKREGIPVGNLGPTDGFRSVGAAVTYTMGSTKITGGVRYVDIGSAVTRGINSNFRSNEGWGFGVRVGHAF
ncbi:hypothetical protein [Rhodovulum adriaticum]|uniref:Long-subunit fatty acid transport protein n=1 Tax=Rhodovulum adriaticum TaxID=35804 RepID=A0A4R2NVG6_RHOAD|nr:hypothetical protein [Rhodovulum adriaticum]MBK1636604.1 hypothetical protein [Rhodovulum adriaticum]TCP26093.1 long-subunit fatty acid transport protein [Rhodovulum adriaticum]